MRKQSLLVVCSLVLLALVSALMVLDVKMPLGISLFVVYLASVPVLMIPGAILNKHLPALRKQRGRDIENEERYEIDGTDFISLRQQPEKKTEESGPYPSVFR